MTGIEPAWGSLQDCCSANVSGTSPRVVPSVVDVVERVITAEYNTKEERLVNPVEVRRAFMCGLSELGLG